MTPSLPAALTTELEAKLEGLSRIGIAARAAAISESYRQGGNSACIRTEIDALAYAFTRMPATYAAVSASLDAISAMAPDFAPQSSLDIGAGPGTGTFAAAERFPTLTEATMLDCNAALRKLALDLARSNPRLQVTYKKADVRAALADASPADLVVASYAIGELTDSGRHELTGLIWEKTRHMLLIVEPGTPTGFERIIAAREQLIGAGAHVTAPCPHDRACPLQTPDWCHFVQRLPRLRAHKDIKHAVLPFEDEKFSYIALSRTAAAHRPARVLAQPHTGKVEVTAKLCTTDGVVFARVPHRDGRAYAQARRWRWGDAVES